MVIFRGLAKPGSVYVGMGKRRTQGIAKTSDDPTAKDLRSLNIQYWT